MTAKQGSPSSGEGDPIETELVAAQSAYIEGTELLAERRRQAVKKALATPGWTKYRIAKLWGVRHNTISAIVESTNRREGKEQS